MKLTKAQRELLEEIGGSEYGSGVMATYPPAVKLVSLGLATLHQQRYGGHILEITPAGREALKGGRTP